MNPLNFGVTGYAGGNDNGKVGTCAAGLNASLSGFGSHATVGPNIYARGVDDVNEKSVGLGVNVLDARIGPAAASVGVNAKAGVHDNGFDLGVSAGKASVGPVNAEIGLKADTKFGDGSAKFLGTGIEWKNGVKFSLFGTSIGFGGN
uniref:Uncharacterized protein n=1 Tax=Panagrolaimus davidi TaxID=227884 RepID=A0A914Q2K9_9BILA